MLFKKKWAAVFLLLSIFLTSCEFKCSVGGDAKKDDKGSAQVKNGTALYNGINLTATGGVQVNRAFLTNEKNERIQPGNLVAPFEKTYLNIIMDSGWIETEDRCYLGASQQVITDKGVEILNNPDLFASMDQTGASPKDAKIISLSVLLQLPANAPPASFTVNYRVWDKKGSGAVSGSYKLFTK
jgi:hypothetical protein